MSSIKEILDKLLKNQKLEETKTVRDVSYLIMCIREYQTQFLAHEECEELLNELYQLNPRMPLSQELLDKFKNIIRKTIDSVLDTWGSSAFSEFKNEANLFCSYATARRENDGSYSIIPVKSNSQLTDFIHKFFLETPTQNLTEALKQHNSEKYKTLLSSKINTYYGSLDFINERTKAIVDAINMIRENYQLAPDEYQFIEIKIVEALELQSKINQIGNVVVKKISPRNHITNMTEDEYHDIVVPTFKKLLQIEKDLSFISQRIWSEYFARTGAKFVHALTSGIVESDVMPKICTTLYKDDLATIPYGHVGYEYDVSMEHIDCICEHDVGSWHINKARFLERGIMHSWQWNEETCMFYEFGYYSKLLPPVYIEKKAREHNLDKEYMSYTEILIINHPKKIKPVKAFCTDLASLEEIEKISELAQKQGIEVEYIDTRAIKQKMNERALS